VPFAQAGRGSAAARRRNEGWESVRFLDFVTQLSFGDFLQGDIKVVDTLASIDRDHGIGTARQFFGALRGEHNENHSIWYFLDRLLEIVVVQMRPPTLVWLTTKT